MQDLRQGVSVHAVKGFPKVDEIDVQRDVPPDALLDDAHSERTSHLCIPVSPESCLLLSQHGVNGCIGSVGKNLAENLRWNRQK